MVPPLLLHWGDYHNIMLTPEMLANSYTKGCHISLSCYNCFHRLLAKAKPVVAVHPTHPNQPDTSKRVSYLPNTLS